MGLIAGCSRESPSQHPAPPRDPTTRRSEQIPVDAIDYAYLKRLWATRGRPWVEGNAGVRHRESGAWVVDSAWSHAPANVGARAYYVGMATTPAVYMAGECNDRELIKELAEFHLAYLNRFETFASLQRWPDPVDDNRFAGATSPDVRTLAWVETQSSGRSRLRECELCNLQGLYPAARLLRLVAELPAEQRSTTLTRFAAAWGPLLVEEHTLRHEPMLDAPRALLSLPEAAIEAAREAARVLDEPTRSLTHAVLDRHLWLMATAAELVGAHDADAKLVALSADAETGLRRIVADGARLLQRKQQRHPTSVSYFDGDFADYPGHEYAGYSGVTFPTRDDRSPVRTVGWDVSHYHRVPLALRALFDNRDALGLDFPTADDLRLAGDHLALVVAASAPSQHPRLSNYSDGSDGWYRVGYHGGEFGYPPSDACDSRSPDRPCLMPGALLGWGALSGSSPSLSEFYGQLVALALSDDPDAIEYRRRALTFDKLEFARYGPDGSDHYPTLLLFALGPAADGLAGCSNEPQARGDSVDS